MTAWVPDSAGVTWFYPLSVMILNPFTFCCFCKGLLVTWYFLCSVSADVLLNVWLSGNTLSFHFTCQHICLFVINAEWFVGSYSATHSSFYRRLLRNNKISQGSSYLSWKTFLNATMKSCKDSLSVLGEFSKLIRIFEWHTRWKTLKGLKEWHCTHSAECFGQGLPMQVSIVSN